MALFRWANKIGAFWIGLTGFLLGFISFASAQGGFNIAGATVRISEAGFVNVSAGHLKLTSYEDSLNGSVSPGLYSEGHIRLKGDWYQEAESHNMDLNNGHVSLLNQDGLQYVFGGVIPHFEQLDIENPDGIIFERGGEIAHTLKLKQGKVWVGEEGIRIKRDHPNAIVQESEDSYVIGPISRKTIAETSYFFPNGDDLHLQAAWLHTAEGHEDQYMKVNFIEQKPDLSYSAEFEGVPINELLDRGYWEIKGEADKLLQFSGKFSSEGHSNGGMHPGQHILMHRQNESWYPFDVAQVPVSEGSGNEKISSYSPLCDHEGEMAIGKAAYILNQELPLKGLSLKISDHSLGNIPPELLVKNDALLQFELSLLDILGQELWQLTENLYPGQHQISIPVQRFSGNTFLLVFKTDQGSKVFKLVKI